MRTLKKLQLHKSLIIHIFYMRVKYPLYLINSAIQVYKYSKQPKYSMLHIIAYSEPIQSERMSLVMRKKVMLFKITVHVNK